MLEPRTEGPLIHHVDLLVHLEVARGWGSEEALAALGEYLLSSEPGRRLGLELFGGHHEVRVT